MKKLRYFSKRAAIKHQSGVVLIITLIVLTAMMLIAAAMIRTTDTSLLAVGNLSLRQAAQAPVNYAIEQVMRDFSNVPANSFPPYIQPRMLEQDNNGIPLILSGNIDALPDGQGITITDVNDFVIFGVVERMCSNTFVGTINTAPDPFLCLVTGNGGTAPNNFAQRNDAQIGDLTTAGAGAPIYRITVRVNGPRNTVAFAQAFLS